MVAACRCSESVCDGALGIAKQIVTECPQNPWYHNPEGQKPGLEPGQRGGSRKEGGAGDPETVGWRIMVDDLLAEIKKDCIFYDTSGGGLTFSGGEPLMQVF